LDRLNRALREGANHLSGCSAAACLQIRAALSTFGGIRGIACAAKTAMDVSAGLCVFDLFRVREQFLFAALVEGNVLGLR
jgi:hypothetical protein